MDNATFEYHQLTEQHIEGALQLSRLAGWNQTAYDFQRLIRLEPLGCFAISSESQLIGTVTNTRYGPNLAWIGMMLVHPDCRRRGLATELITLSLRYLRDKGTECIKLDATPAGQKVYEKLGFEVEWPFHRWVLERGNQDASTTRPMPHPRPSAVPARRNREVMAESVPHELQPGNTFSQAILRLDKRAFGADRSLLIQDLAPGTRSRLGTAAYGLLRAGYLADYLGPVVADTPTDAQSIIGQLVDSTPRTIFWDAPAPNQAATSIAESFGFQPTRDLTRMQIGAQHPPPDYEKQYAMFDPSVG